MTAPENPTGNVEQAIGEVLERCRGYTLVGGRPGTFVCTCGIDLGVSSYPDPAHRAHVAEQITPLVDAARAEARKVALLEAADRMPAFHDRDAPEWAITSACRWLRERAERETP